MEWCRKHNRRDTSDTAAVVRVNSRGGRAFWARGCSESKIGSRRCQATNGHVVCLRVWTPVSQKHPMCSSITIVARSTNMYLRLHPATHIEPPSFRYIARMCQCTAISPSDSRSFVQHLCTYILTQLQKRLQKTNVMLRRTKRMRMHVEH